MSDAVVKAEERDTCNACGWEQQAGWEVCHTTAEALRRNCARYNPPKTEPDASTEVSGIVFSGTPRSPSDFH